MPMATPEPPTTIASCTDHCLVACPAPQARKPRAQREICNNAAPLPNGAYYQSGEDAWELFRVGLPDGNNNVEIHNLSGLEHWGIDAMVASHLKDEAIRLANLGSPAPR